MASHNDVDGQAIYFIRTHEERPECLEMGFELSAYQPQVLFSPRALEAACCKLACRLPRFLILAPDPLASDPPREQLKQRKASGGEKIYQTIYLDKTQSELWSIDKLDSSKIVDRAWWSAFSHTFTHFRWVVPWTWTMQGHRNTWYAGSWTLFNTHDIAISSGLAAAERLGAPYPFTHNAMATATYDTVLGASH